jgi:hypothetical protein
LNASTGSIEVQYSMLQDAATVGAPSYTSYQECEAGGGQGVTTAAGERICSDKVVGGADVCRPFTAEMRTGVEPSAKRMIELATAVAEQKEGTAPEGPLSISGASLDRIMVGLTRKAGSMKHLAGLQMSLAVVRSDEQENNCSQWL